jgi:hypothetical protein
VDLQVGTERFLDFALQFFHCPAHCPWSARRQGHGAGKLGGSNAQILHGGRRRASNPRPRPGWHPASCNLNPGPPSASVSPFHEDGVALALRILTACVHLGAASKPASARTVSRERTHARTHARTHTRSLTSRLNGSWCGQKLLAWPRGARDCASARSAPCACCPRECPLLTTTLVPCPTPVCSARARFLENF